MTQPKTSQEENTFFHENLTQQVSALGSDIKAMRHNFDTDHDLLVVVHTNQLQLSTDLKEMMPRMKSLEKWRYYITGGLVVLGAMSAPNIGAIARAFTGI